VNQNTKTVIVTGVLGFIGSHTAKTFKEAGYNVIGIDREWTMNEGANYVDQLLIADFVNIVSVIVSNNNVDAIIHIAGTSLVGPSILNPGEYYNNNSFKTNSMLEQLSKINWKGSIVFSSSAAVYGNNDSVSSWNEDYPKDPVSPYGRSKLMCEHIIEDHCRAHGFKGIALRYFNASGCDQNGKLGCVKNDTHLIPKIIQSVLENSRFTLNGKDFQTPDGTCIRDYIHVSDIANAHLMAVEFLETLDNHTFQAYNIGTGAGFSNLEIVKMVEQVIQKDIQIVYGPIRAGDPNQLIANPNLFINNTKWEPKYSSLKTIVETTYNWMKGLYETSSINS
jgi:UDP-glucose 4-epimerase